MLCTAGVIFLAVKFEIPDKLLKEMDKITNSDVSIDQQLHKRHYISKKLASDTTIMSSETKKELEKVLNYQQSAGRQLDKSLRK